MANEFRLSEKVYEQLENQLPVPMVTKDTSEHQIGFLLGIQFVLKTLRKGFVVNDSNQAGEQAFRTRAR